MMLLSGYLPLQVENIHAGLSVEKTYIPQMLLALLQLLREAHAGVSNKILSRGLKKTYINSFASFEIV